MTTPPIYSSADGDDEDPLDPRADDQMTKEVELGNSVLKSIPKPLLDEKRDVVTPPTPNSQRPGPATGADTARTPPVATLEKPDTRIGSLTTLAGSAARESGMDVDRKWAAEQLGTRLDSLFGVVDAQGSIAPLPTGRPSLRLQ